LWFALFSEIPAEKNNRGEHKKTIESAMKDTEPKRKVNESDRCPDPTQMHNKDNKKLPDQGSPSASTTPTKGDKGVQRE